MSRRARTGLIGFLGIVTLLPLPQPGLAQVTIQIIDAEGRPIPAVRVDVMGTGEILEVASAARDGTVTLVTDRWPEVRRLSLSHLGFQTLIVQADEIPSDGLIRLEPAAVEIEGVLVQGRADLCPVDDNAEARRLWAEVAALYSTDTGSRALSGTMLKQAGWVRETELHRVDESQMLAHVYGRAAGVVHGGDLDRRPMDDRVVTEGYVWEAFDPAGLRARRDTGRMYAPLEIWHAYHFASPVFGALHNFDIVNEGESETTLAFCPNGSGNGASIHGVISMVPRERFVAAEWRFQTDDPDEGAGGDLVFRPVGPHLLAQRGIFFYHSGQEPPFPDLPRDYYREVIVLTSWQLHPTGQLPCRRSSGLHVYSLPPGSPDGEAFRDCVTRNREGP